MQAVAWLSRKVMEEMVVQCTPRAAAASARRVAAVRFEARRVECRAESLMRREPLAQNAHREWSAIIARAEHIAASRGGRSHARWIARGNKCVVTCGRAMKRAGPAASN